MGYLDDEVKRLQGVIANLEGRVKALEDGRLGGSSKKTADEVRMILIGPPGAGTLGGSTAITTTMQTDTGSLTGAPHTT